MFFSLVGGCSGDNAIGATGGDDAASSDVTPIDSSQNSEARAIDADSSDAAVPRKIALPGVCEIRDSVEGLDAASLPDVDLALGIIVDDCASASTTTEATDLGLGDYDITVACCTGLVCDHSYDLSLCVVPDGAHCDLDAGLECTIRSQCDESKTCVPLTCIPTTVRTGCFGLDGLDCCDPSAVCGPASAISKYCCYPPTTIIPDGGLAKCCSGTPPVDGECF